MKLKIAINIKNINNSYGGGNQFLNCLTSHLKKKNFIIKNNLIDSDIDLILLIDPRLRHPLLNFSIGQIFRYVKYKNPNAIVVHRINECDERKNTNFMNKLLKYSNHIADHTVFTSRWLKKLDVSQRGSSSLIYNGPDKVIFYPRKYKKIYPPYKIITHHWSDNWMKGFDTYKKIDDLINRKFWNKKIQFTYIGRIPKNFQFKNTKVLKPMHGKKLSDEICKHHIYVTGSINEPGGNHQHEGALCGLPLLYIKSGAFPEQCKGFGVEFKFKNFEKSLLEIIKSYTKYYRKMKFYPFTSDRMINNYEKLFKELVTNREKILSKRKNKMNWFNNLRFLITP